MASALGATGSNRHLLSVPDRKKLKEEALCTASSLESARVWFLFWSSDQACPQFSLLHHLSLFSSFLVSYRSSCWEEIRPGRGPRGRRQRPHLAHSGEGPGCPHPLTPGWAPVIRGGSSKFLCQLCPGQTLNPAGRLRDSSLADMGCTWSTLSLPLTLQGAPDSASASHPTLSALTGPLHVSGPGHHPAHSEHSFWPSCPVYPGLTDAPTLHQPLSSWNRSDAKMSRGRANEKLFLGSIWLLGRAWRALGSLW